jgi:putative transcriptional regulator
MSKAGKRLLIAAKEAVAIARGEVAPARIYIPADIRVKDIRTKLDLSQDDFAYQFGFTVNQIRDWEQGRSRPIGGVRAYLMLIDREPDGVRNLLTRLRKESRKAA